MRSEASMSMECLKLGGREARKPSFEVVGSRLDCLRGQAVEAFRAVEEILATVKNGTIVLARLGILVVQIFRLDWTKRSS
jgi:hypothetical protein